MENDNGGAKTKQQIAAYYGVCTKTFSRLLQKKNVRLDRGLIFPKDQIRIYKKLGTPGSVSK